jgi:hypothetical protein
MFQTMGYGVYFFFASLMILSVIFVYYFIPETKGIPLEAMDRLFSNEIPARKAHKIIMAEVRLEDEDFRRTSFSHGVKMDETGYMVGDKHEEYVNEKNGSDSV